ncbi:MAG: uracil-DNA glycosylase [Cytophagales bacterium CG12_big_fil_rev_8_21_14_0_65_40_12]|nr:MAG: uracil-DNA glycosylase [Cytophagales bacterium CG12_big_fil_rev_8_21_14_0_65_40_12]PIW05557.1 MAG: uracil-DNA glycosylase [Cytophagales bacterium CG17_big_fil_post_rev_8_21_14_2_50_40_13]
MNVKIAESWKKELSNEFEQEYFCKLTAFVRNEYQTQTVYPAGNNIFRAFDRCSFDNVKVVILGQDPYHGPNQANGLCFSVKEGIPFPPSLVNIFKEIKDDIGKEIPPHGSLDRWADQGVLLLNATLTVRAHEAGSHQNMGWETFTDAVIHRLASQRKGIVYMLWGSYAQKKAAFVSSADNLILKAPHPSPLSSYRGFFGCKHFSKANEYLEEKGLSKIKW